ncbi:hypothetical protein Pelo_2905 [Pelomyxa schiedti]|nr:hypothetical protein Pelo_2905 [Pelomyxa schiedti]
MSVTRRFVVVVVVVLIWWSECVTSMVKSRSYHVTSNPQFLESSYGLMEGATFKADMAAKYDSGDAATISVLLCTHSETETVLQYANNVHDIDESSHLCQTCSCNVTSLSENGKIDIDAVLYKYDLYYLLVLNCNASQEYNLNATWTLLNPNGEQLPCGYMPFPDMYIILSIVWLASVSIWTLSLLQGWLRKAIKLHIVISLYGVSKFTWAGFNIFYWKSISNDGYISDLNDMLYLVVQTFFQSSFFLMLLLLGTGWCIIYGSIMKDLPWVIGLMIGFIFCMFTQSFVSQNIISIVVRLGFVVFRVFIVMYVFITVNRNIRELNERVIETPNPPPGTQIYIDQERKRILLSLKVFIVVWLVLSMVIYFVLLLFVHDWMWVVQLLSESVDFMMFILVGITYRVREVPIFWGCPVIDAADPAGVEYPAHSTSIFQNESLARRVQALLSRAPTDAHTS